MRTVESGGGVGADAVGAGLALVAGGGPESGCGDWGAGGAGLCAHSTGANMAAAMVYRIRIMRDILPFPHRFASRRLGKRKPTAWRAGREEALGRCPPTAGPSLHGSLARSVSLRNDRTLWKEQAGEGARSTRALI